MTKDERNAIALFRYGVIAPLESGAAGTPSNNAFFRQASDKTYTGTDGKPTTVAASTIEKWHLAYKKGGFDALMPQSRKDEGNARKLSDDVQREIRELLTENPTMTAVNVQRTLQRRGSIDMGEVSISTIERYVRSIRSLEGYTNNKDMRRYECEHINAVWYGDTCYGPYLSEGGKKRRVFFIALIDDASRFIVGADAFYNDNFENFMAVAKSAVSKYGRPKLFTLDNGKTYNNTQMRLLAARIGSAVHYCEPYTPTSKSKIERFWLTARNQYISNINTKEFHSLEELRVNFAEYVAGYNTRVHSSLNGQTPQERFFSEPEQIRRLTQEQIDQSFLLEAERRVSNDCVLTLNNQEYEVHYRYAKQKIRLLYTPDLQTVYVVDAFGELSPIHLLNKHDNASVKRERVRLSEGDEEP